MVKGLRLHQSGQPRRTHLAKTLRNKDRLQQRLLFLAGHGDQQSAGGLGVEAQIDQCLFHTLGELCISPVGLSMVTKLAPLRLASLMMGVWLLINFFANLLAGYVGAFSEHMAQLHRAKVKVAQPVGGVGLCRPARGRFGLVRGVAIILQPVARRKPAAARG